MNVIDLVSSDDEDHDVPVVHRDRNLVSLYFSLQSATENLRNFRKLGIVLPRDLQNKVARMNYAAKYVCEYTALHRYVLSIDIGIKNLGFCLFDMANIQATTKVKMLHWGVKELATDINDRHILTKTALSIREIFQTVKTIVYQMPVSLIIEEQYINPRKLLSKVGIVNLQIMAQVIALAPWDDCRIVHSATTSAMIEDWFEINPIKRKRQNVKNRYKVKKAISVNLVDNQFEDSNLVDNMDEYKKVWDTSMKRDDMADCFIQGVVIILANNSLLDLRHDLLK
ncbi:hypothetical protein ROZALSC1DRAFT_27115 [Rozella allomycis CSF55]|uniref:Uncharacterized protein n=1 Tax=Rozella allomycis (strain CSF55) TaxID=988480 RepID=A0A075AQL9_ROZAC|nr:hypothetical protein O9G_006169 [Rozella allomycis CSF55]RKP21473.1 hypothetical protein ROZALSC1DRAFT_27115 [Rozella allomycis CSF55]|eukprot:EPZ30887.1 hypothetical protein O9G_006169 [Rozella allomycis CSF55]